MVERAAMLTPRGRFAILVLALAAIGCAAHWPALHSGLAADDYLQRSMLDGSYPVHRSPADLFSFVDAARGDLAPLVDAGTFPWWVHPGLELSALRPLSSLLIALDVKVLGLSAFAQHVHSLLWWLALLLGFAAFVRQRMPVAVAALATAIFAFDPASVLPIGWLANRNAIVSALFGLIALAAHAAWRERGWRPGPIVAGLAFALSLAGGEYALGMFGYLLAYELVAGTGGARRRLRSLVPVSAPLVAYLALHIGLGYGAQGSSLYVDPLRHPELFAAGALTKLPALVIGELYNIPGEFAQAALLGRFAGVLLLLPGLIAIAALSPGAVRRLDPEPRRTLLVLLLGSALSLLPVLGAMPSARLLLVPSLGGSVFIAVLITDAAQRFRETGALKRMSVWLGGVVGLGLFGSHVLGAPLTSYAASTGWTAAQRLARSLYRRAELDDRKLPQQTVVLLNSMEPLTLIYPPYVRHQYGSPMPGAWRAISTTVEPVQVRRTSRDTIELRTVQSGLLQAPTAGLLRSTDLPIRTGQRFHLRGMDVEVLATDGWGPKRVRYRFDGDLDSPRFVFLMMSANGLRRLRIPPPGQTLALPGIPKEIIDALRRP